MQKTLFLTFGGALVVGIIGFLVLNGSPKTNEQIVTQFSTDNPNPINAIQADQPKQKANNTTNKNISISDVEKHSKRSDCWLVVNNKVYDITEYIPQHPGGSIIVQGCGTDATTMFEMQRKHQRGEAQSLLSKFYIGDLKT